MGTAVLPACASPPPAGKPARPRPMPSMVGELGEYVARHEDTLLDIARDNNLGFVELVAANPGIDPWIPGEGTRIMLPTAHLLPDGPREGVLLNLVDQRLYYFPRGKPIETYPIGTGQEAWNTPLGATTIVKKIRNPSWYVPESIRKERPELPAVIRPGPNNPLGQRALYLGWSSYLIHGTNNPWGVGRRVSHGCIRMYPEGIAKLFEEVAVGTKVTVVSQELKIGWHLGALFIEVHPNAEQQIDLEAKGKAEKMPVPELAYRVATAAGEARKRINWAAVRRAGAERRGLPIPVLLDE